MTLTVGLYNRAQVQYVSEDTDYPIPDILSYLQSATNLKRETIVEILLKSERLDNFKDNPQKFID